MGAFPHDSRLAGANHYINLDKGLWAGFHDGILYLGSYSNFDLNMNQDEVSLHMFELLSLSFGFCLSHIPDDLVRSNSSKDDGGARD